MLSWCQAPPSRGCVTMCCSVCCIVCCSSSQYFPVYLGCLDCVLACLHLHALLKIYLFADVYMHIQFLFCSLPLLVFRECVHTRLISQHTHTHKHTQRHTQTHTLTHTHTNTHTLYLSLSHTHTHTFKIHTIALSLSPTHTIQRVLCAHVSQTIVSTHAHTSAPRTPRLFALPTNGKTNKRKNTKTHNRTYPLPAHTGYPSYPRIFHTHSHNTRSCVYVRVCACVCACCFVCVCVCACVLEHTGHSPCPRISILSTHLCLQK